MEMKLKELSEHRSRAQKILVGIGEAFEKKQTDKKEQGKPLIKFYVHLAHWLEGTDYFVITLRLDEEIKRSGLETERIVEPCRNDMQIQWEHYQDWIAKTMNRDTLLLELGVSFTMPELIRWPFERMAFYNQKAHLYRVHSQFWQLSPELTGKGTSFQMNPVTFLGNL